MQFTLERISGYVKEKIIADAERHGKLSVEFKKYGEVYWFEKPAWAFAREGSTYFIKAPRHSEIGSLRQNYYIFSKGTWFKLYRLGRISSEVAIEGHEQIVPEVLARLKDEIRAAFKVFGADGNGDELGGSAMSLPIVPVFVDETKS